LYNNKYPLPSSRFINHSQYQKNSKKCYWGTSTLILKNLKFPKVTKSLANFKKRVLNPLIKNLKKKEIIILSMNSSKRKKVISSKFSILKNGEGEKFWKRIFLKKGKLFNL